MPVSSKQWERVWRQAGDEFLIQSASDHLRRNLASSEPDFDRLTQICREAHRRGRPELLMRALEQVAPIRTVSGEDLRVLLDVVDALSGVLAEAGRRIVRSSGRREAHFVELIGKRLKEARAAAARFVPKGKDE